LGGRFLPLLGQVSLHHALDLDRDMENTFHEYYSLRPNDDKYWAVTVLGCEEDGKCRGGKIVCSNNNFGPRPRFFHFVDKYRGHVQNKPYRA
jgi:hypothetical protein